MLILKCSACRKKLWRYDKIGQGELIRCHKARIDRMYGSTFDGHKIHCCCGREVGIDKGSYYQMIKGAFTASGSKRNSREKNKRRR